MPIEITVDGAEVTRRYLGRFASEMKPAIARAANRAAESGRAFTIRELTAGAGLTQKYGRRSVRIARRATQNNPFATVTARGYPLPLVAYVGTKGFRSGLGIAGRAYRLGAVPAGSFYARVRGKSGTGGDHRGIFRRRGRKRTPIDEVLGPSIPDLVISQSIFDRAEVRVLEVYAQRLEHELGRLEAGHA